MFFAPWQESSRVAEFVRIPRWFDCELSASIRSAWLRSGGIMLSTNGSHEFCYVGTSDKVAGPLCLSLRSRNLSRVAEFVRIPRWFACELSASAPLGWLRSAWHNALYDAPGRILTNSATRGTSDKVAGPLCSFAPWQESHLVAEFVRIPRWIACDLSASGPLGSLGLQNSHEFCYVGRE